MLKAFVGRQLCGGPICEWLAPFWGTFKLFKKVAECFSNTALFKKFCFNVGFGHIKVAAPQAGFFGRGRLPKDHGSFEKVLCGAATLWGPDL